MTKELRVFSGQTPTGSKIGSFEALDCRHDDNYNMEASWSFMEIWSALVCTTSANWVFSYYSLVLHLVDNCVCFWSTDNIFHWFWREYSDPQEERWKQKIQPLSPVSGLGSESLQAVPCTLICNRACISCWMWGHSHWVDQFNNGLPNWTGKEFTLFRYGSVNWPVEAVYPGVQAKHIMMNQNGIGHRAGYTVTKEECTCM